MMSRIWTLRPTLQCVRALGTSASRYAPGPMQPFSIAVPHIDPMEPVHLRRKRLLYQSKKRGWKETDLILGRFAMDNIDKLTEDELLEYELLINQVDADVFAWITNRVPTPPELDTSVTNRLKEFVAKNAITSPNYDV